MHIVLVIFSLDSGGAEKVISALANYWTEKGHKIVIVTLSSPQSLPFYLLHPSIKLIQLNEMNQTSSGVNRMKNIYKRLSKLRKTLKNLAPQVIVSFTDVMNITTLIAARGLKIPVIVSERTHPANHKLPLLYPMLRIICYPQAHKVIVQTASIKKFFQSLKNLTVIPNIVKPPEKLARQVNLSVKTIISIGRLCAFKGYDTLINAFNQLQMNDSNLRLVIYGEGKDRERLTHLIHSLNLENKIQLPGAVKNLDQHLLKADLFIFPSHYEGFPNALCEAMAAGLPVIASNCSGNIDIVQDGINGRLFPVKDVTMLVSITRELINDVEQRQKLSNHAKTLADHFSPNKIYPLWDQVLENVSGHHTAG